MFAVKKWGFSLRILLLSFVGAMALSTAAFATDTAAPAPTIAPNAAVTTMAAAPAPSTTAPQQTTAPLTVNTPGTPAPTASAEDPDEVICRMEDPPTGSRLGGHHVCRKRSVWEQMAKDAQKTLGNIETHGLESQRPGN